MVIGGSLPIRCERRDDKYPPVVIGIEMRTTSDSESAATSVSRRASNCFAGIGSIAARSSIRSEATVPGLPRVVRS